MAKKRKSEDDPTPAAAVTSTSSASASKKRRRLSDADADENAPKADKKPKKDKKEKKEKKSKKSSSKKDKHHKHETSAEDESPADIEIAGAEDTPAEANGVSEDTPMNDAPIPEGSAKAEGEKPSKESKKEKKNKKEKKAKNKDKKQSAAQPSTDETPTNTTTTEANESTTAQQEQEKDDSTANKKSHRFIVFVGNLPYAATVPQIEAHFSAVHPASVRLLHDARTGRSRGVAFVEFARYDHMKACLKTMHHSTFTCPSDKGSKTKNKTEERKINVELTAGGGGNTAFRKDKIRAKNFKLNEERERRAHEEQKAKAEKEKEKGEKGGEAGKDEKVGGGMEDSVHPSRRRRVPGAGSS